MNSILILIFLFAFLCLFGIGYVIYTIVRALTVPNTSFLERIFWVVAIVIFMPFVSVIFSLVKEPTWKGKIGPSLVMIATIILMLGTASHFAIDSVNDFKDGFETYMEEQEHETPPDNYNRQEPIQINTSEEI